VIGLRQGCSSAASAWSVSCHLILPPVSLGPGRAPALPRVPGVRSPVSWPRPPIR